LPWALLPASTHLALPARKPAVAAAAYPERGPAALFGEVMDDADDTDDSVCAPPCPHTGAWPRIEDVRCTHAEVCALVLRGGGRRPPPPARSATAVARCPARGVPC
jgi:hypothetical protein